MQPQDVKTIDDCKKIIAHLKPNSIQVGAFDLNGILRGKYLSVSKFLGALDKGFGMCNVCLGADVEDIMIPGLEYTGWHTGYPDAPMRVVPESCRLLPYTENTLFFLTEFAGSAEHLCPRSILRKVVSQANEMGFYPYAGMEYEFTAFAEDTMSLEEKGFRHLDTITPGKFGYSALRLGNYADFHEGFLRYLTELNIDLECLHTEVGPGILEAAIAADDAVLSADKAALFKTMSKIYASHQQITLNFMAKWSLEEQGQSGHIHISLKNANGDNVFYDADQPYTMSQTMQHFLAGQQKLMPELLALVANNVNSFVRLQPGFWAPTSATWGVDNRTCALRVIPGSAKAQRVEYRIPAADTNPYLAYAVAIASGLYGIAHKLPLAEPLTGNAYGQQHAEHLQLPRTLGEAARRLQNSAVAKELFGEAMINDYAKTRLWEQAEADKQVTDWQLKRYFEIV